LPKRRPRCKRAMETRTEFIPNLLENPDVCGVHKCEGAARALSYRINRDAVSAFLRPRRVALGVTIDPCSTRQPQLRLCDSSLMHLWSTSLLIPETLRPATRQQCVRREERGIFGDGVAQKARGHSCAPPFALRRPGTRAQFFKKTAIRKTQYVFKPSFVFAIGLAQCRVPLSSSSARLVLVTC
jgi:hypothetical protein